MISWYGKNSVYSGHGVPKNELHKDRGRSSKTLERHQQPLKVATSSNGRVFIDVTNRSATTAARAKMTQDLQQSGSAAQRIGPFMPPIIQCPPDHEAMNFSQLTSSSQEYSNTSRSSHESRSSRSTRTLHNQSDPPMGQETLSVTSAPSKASRGIYPFNGHEQTSSVRKHLAVFAVPAFKKPPIMKKNLDLRWCPTQPVVPNGLHSQGYRVPSNQPIPTSRWEQNSSMSLHSTGPVFRSSISSSKSSTTTPVGMLSAHQQRPNQSQGTVDTRNSCPMDQESSRSSMIPPDSQQAKFNNTTLSQASHFSDSSSSKATSMDSANSIVSEHSHLEAFVDARVEAFLRQDLEHKSSEIAKQVKKADIHHMEQIQDLDRKMSAVHAKVGDFGLQLDEATELHKTRIMDLDERSSKLVTLSTTVDAKISTVSMMLQTCETLVETSKKSIEAAVGAGVKSIEAAVVTGTKAIETVVGAGTMLKEHAKSSVVACSRVIESLLPLRQGASRMGGDICREYTLSKSMANLTPAMSSSRIVPGSAKDHGESLVMSEHAITSVCATKNRKNNRDPEELALSQPHQKKKTKKMNDSVFSSSDISFGATVFSKVVTEKIGDGFSLLISPSQTVRSCVTPCGKSNSFSQLNDWSKLNLESDKQTLNQATNGKPQRAKHFRRAFGRERTRILDEVDNENDAFLSG